jgi:hypothetical protein
METMKINDQELKEFQELQEKINQNVFDLGQIEVHIFNIKEQQASLEKQKGDILSFLELISKKELEFLNNLESKYGKGMINPATGEIIPS